MGCGGTTSAEPERDAGDDDEEEEGADAAVEEEEEDDDDGDNACERMASLSTLIFKISVPLIASSLSSA